MSKNDVQEALDELVMDAIVGNSSDDHEFMNPENYRICENRIYALKGVIRQALQSQKAVDVEGLYKPNPPFDEAYEDIKTIGWNECLNHLREQGVI